MKTEIKVYFRMTGFSKEPSHLAHEVGIQPDRIWKIGEPRKIAKGTFKENGWELCSRSDKKEELEVHLNDVLKRIRPCAKKISTLAKKFPTLLSCVIYSYGGDRPAITFPPSALRELASFNVTLDVDLYILS